MSTVAEIPVLRPRATGLKGWIDDHLLGGVAILLGLLRATFPILRIGKTCFVTRYDDVREVLASDVKFPVHYKDVLDVVMGGEPFMLGLTDPQQAAAEIAALGSVVRRDDLTRLAAQVEADSEAIVAGAGGRLDIVAGLSRPLAFDFIKAYLGLAAIPDAQLRGWATRLFEFVFFGGDADLTREATGMAPALRAAVDAEIARAKASPDPGTVLGRCIARQRQGDAHFTDDWIRTNLAGLIVGGPPQPPVVVPHMLDELFRRPAALASACAAARAGDDALLYGHLIEALRFHPLAPAIKRYAPADATLAQGTGHDKRIPAGTTLLVGIGSAMFDPRRIGEPQRFDPQRLPHEYLHFGFGLHECFARHINRATLPMMLKPLLKRGGLRRAEGKAGRMSVRGPFPEAMWVTFDPEPKAAAAPSDNRS